MSGIFSSDKIYLTMKLISKEHKVEYLKRLAKKIKKEQGIPYHQCLDTVAVNIGFSNWKHFLHNKSENLKNLPSNDNYIIEPVSANEKLNPYRNLIVAATNELIIGKHISLSPDNIDPEQENGHIFLNLFGQPSVILWSNRGFDELLISVWWKYDHSKHPQANLEGNAKENFTTTEPLAKKQHYKKFVGVVVRCWLERRSGKYLQGENQDYISIAYTRRGELANLKEIPTQKPNGYKSSGPFHF
jgi:hypothetical protein